jgi:transient receptor potential cation channel subfamily A protein 1
MMIGEIEFGDVFLGTNGLENDPDGLHSTQLYYSGVAILLFIFFIIFMNIIIMNLLIGLAVDDIKAVQDKAVLKRLTMQVCDRSLQQ